MMNLQPILIFLAGTIITLCGFIASELIPEPTPHKQCLEDLKELDQRAKETWQRPEIPNGTWEQSKTRLLHSNSATCITGSKACRGILKVISGIV
ncbi:hypothetical protein EAF04_008444 [Stromatinia cepivora]|nr:hypothetical protein EAF04_008444 [Stromatinia cepivora]